MGNMITMAAALESYAEATERPVKCQSDQAFETLYRKVVRCELVPGITVSEAELAERFDLKRAAARAAVDRLSVMGLLRPVRRRGYVVKPITLRDVNDLFELRTIIEVAASRLGVGRVDEFSLRRLDRVCSAGYRPGDRESEAKFLQANSEFHLTVAMATGNDRLVATLAQILREMERLFHFGLALRNRSDEMQQEHQALIDALASGDADEVERVVREELASSKSMVLDALMSSEALLDVSISDVRTVRS
jgi:DNA-binding GntR family transcriptional regulator